MDRIVRTVKRLDGVSLLRVDGALQMFPYLRDGRRHGGGGSGRARRAAPAGG